LRGDLGADRRLAGLPRSVKRAGICPSQGVTTVATKFGKA
jgi:hypothetical protein